MKKTLLLATLTAFLGGVSHAQTLVPATNDAQISIPANLNVQPKGIKHSARVGNNVDLRISHTDAIVNAFGVANFGSSSFIDYYCDTTLRVSFSGQLLTTGFNGVGGMFNPYQLFFDEPLPTGTGYRLDTVWIGGIYQRIVNNTVGDTLRVQVNFGPNTATGSSATSGAPWVALRFNATAPAPIANRAVTGQIFAGAPGHGLAGNLSASTVTVNYVLTAADTISNPTVNPNYPYIPIVMPNGGLQIPANNWVSTLARYRTGNPTTPGDIYWSNVPADTAVHNSFRPLAWVESANPAAHVFMFDSTGLSTTLTRVARYGANAGQFWASPRTDRGYWIDFSINATLPGTSVEGIPANIARVGNVYPNPVNAGATLVLPVDLKNSSKVSYSISNYMGQMIAREDLGQLFEGANKIEVNTQTLNAGVYFMTVNINGATQAIRFVVNK
ncbi:MAG: T9SS type A sorting domain-containing protein [Sphingobacteriaceae bacterium]|nr:T9SS type A sorting domain-containing protein [Sphingobacteriaceae bacterium]